MTRARKASLYAMASLYLLAGINHLVHPRFYLAIMPSWIGHHELLVGLSGLCEIILAVLLLPLRTRRLAAWGIIALLVAVFPANIQMMIRYIEESRPGWWLTVLRLPLQLVLVWWAYTFTRKQRPELLLIHT